MSPDELVNITDPWAPRSSALEQSASFSFTWSLVCTSGNAPVENIPVSALSVWSHKVSFALKRLLPCAWVIQLRQHPQVFLPTGCHTWVLGLARISFPFCWQNSDKTPIKRHLHNWKSWESIITLVFFF